MNVCVNLTHPMRDIIDNTVNVFVIDHSSSLYIPADAPLASEYLLSIVIVFPLLSFPAPDGPNFLSQYTMAEGTDFAKQTRAVNVIDDIIISQERRIICYNQPIYDDLCLEPDEYAGLTLGVINYNDFDQTTIVTEVEPLFDQAAIFIVDNDSEFQQC